MKQHDDVFRPEDRRTSAGARKPDSTSDDADGAAASALATISPFRPEQHLRSIGLPREAESQEALILNERMELLAALSYRGRFSVQPAAERTRL